MKTLLSVTAFTLSLAAGAQQKVTLHSKCYLDTVGQVPPQEPSACIAAATFPTLTSATVLGRWEFRNGVTASNGRVSAWTDQKNGFVLSPITSANGQPFYDSCLGVRFNLAQGLRLASLPVNASDVTVFAVVTKGAYTSTVGMMFYEFSNNYNQNNAFASVFAESGAGTQGDYAAIHIGGAGASNYNIAGYNGVATRGVPGVWTLDHRTSKPGVASSENETFVSFNANASPPVFTYTNDLPTTNFGSNSFTIGCRSDGTTQSLFAEADVRALIMVTGLISSSDRAAIQNYLKTKYKVSY